MNHWSEHRKCYLFHVLKYRSNQSFGFWFIWLHPCNVTAFEPVAIDCEGICIAEDSAVVFVANAAVLFMETQVRANEEALSSYNWDVLSRARYLSQLLLGLKIPPSRCHLPNFTEQFQIIMFSVVRFYRFATSSRTGRCISRNSIRQHFDRTCIGPCTNALHRMPAAQSYQGICQ